MSLGRDRALVIFSTLERYDAYRAKLYPGDVSSGLETVLCYPDMLETCVDKAGYVKALVKLTRNVAGNEEIFAEIPQVYTLQVMLIAKLGFEMLALRLYGFIHELFPQYERAWLNHADLLRRMGDENGAYELLNEKRLSEGPRAEASDFPEALFLLNGTTQCCLDDLACKQEQQKLMFRLFHQPFVPVEVKPEFTSPSPTSVQF
jgi:hypothetical protein